MRSPYELARATAPMAFSPFSPDVISFFKKIETSNLLSRAILPFYQASMGTNGVGIVTMTS